MSEHDLLCPQSEIQRSLRELAGNDTQPPCGCDVIAEACANERERIAQAIEAVDVVEWALWGQHAGYYAARIARNGGGG